MKVNYRIIETDADGTRTLVEKHNFGVNGNDFEAIKAAFECTMRLVYQNRSGLDFSIEPA